MKPDHRNLLDLRPRCQVNHRLEDGRVVLLVPRFRARWLGWLQRCLRRPHILVRLDDVGSAVWLACDGQRTVSEIGRRLTETFGSQIEPVWDRLAFFMRQMRRGELIELVD